MKNEVEIDGDVARIIIPRRDRLTVVTVIDLADLELVSGISGRWYAHREKRSGAVYVFGHPEPNRPVYLHRYLTGALKGLDVDHINHDRLDNRRSNLRVVTRAVNQANRPGANRNSKSGVRGVSWSEQIQRWKVFISRNNRQVFIGSFTDLGEAESAAREVQLIAADRVAA